MDLSHADYHLDQYTDHNDVIDYYKDDDDGTSSRLTDHTKTGLYRAEVAAVHEQIDAFSGTTVKHQQIKILGYYTTEEAAQAKIKEYNDAHHPTKKPLPKIHKEPSKKPSLEWLMDPVRLKRENEILIDRVFRRTTLLESLRKSYLEDVVLVKEQLRERDQIIATMKEQIMKQNEQQEQIENNQRERKELSPSTVVPDPTTTPNHKNNKKPKTIIVGHKTIVLNPTTSTINPTAKFVLPANQLPSLKGIEYNLLDRMLPSFDLRHSLPLFGPTDTALLSATPCQFCGGTVDVACFDEVAVYEIKKEFITLQTKHKKILLELAQAKEAVKHLQNVCTERIYQAQDATNLVGKLRSNVTRLMNENHKNYITVHGKDTFDEKHKTQFLLDQHIMLEKKYDVLLDQKKHFADAEMEINAKFDSVTKKLAQEKFVVVGLKKKLEARDRAITAHVTTIKNITEKQKVDRHRSGMALEESLQKHTMAQVEHNTIIAQEKATVCLWKGRNEELKLNTTNQLRSMNEKVIKHQESLIKHRKHAGLSLVMKCLKRWGLRRNQRYLEVWRRHTQMAIKKDTTSFKNNVQHIKQMLKESRRRAGVQHILRMEAVAREGALKIQIQGKQDEINRVQQLNMKSRRRSLILEMAAKTGPAALHLSLRRKSIAAEQLIRFQNQQLRNIVRQVTQELKDKSIVLLCHQSLQEGVALAFIKKDQTRQLLQHKKEQHQKIEFQNERNQWSLEKNRCGMTIEDQPVYSRFVRYKWSKLVYHVLYKQEQIHSNILVDGWNNEKMAREEDAELFHQKLTTEQTRVSTLTGENEKLDEIRCGQKEKITSCTLQLKACHALEKKLNVRLIEVNEKKKQAMAEFDSVNEVVLVLSNRIILERRYRNVLFTTISCFMADALMATSLEEENIENIEKEGAAGAQAQVKKLTMQQLPAWSRNFDSTNEAVLEKDVQILLQDLKRLRDIVWVESTKKLRLMQWKREYAVKLKLVHQQKEALKTTIRRFTLAMPTEQRRKILKKKKLAKSAQAQSDIQAQVINSIKLRMMSPDKFSNTLSPVKNMWNKLSPL